MTVRIGYQSMGSYTYMTSTMRCAVVSGAVDACDYLYIQSSAYTCGARITGSGSSLTAQLFYTGSTRVFGMSIIRVEGIR